MSDNFSLSRGCRRTSQSRGAGAALVACCRSRDKQVHPEIMVAAADPGISFHYPALHCFHHPASLKPVTIRSPWAPLLGLSCVISTFCNRPLFAFAFWKNHTSEGKGAKLNTACETDQSQEKPFFKTCGTRLQRPVSLFLSWSDWRWWWAAGQGGREAATCNGRNP